MQGVVGDAMTASVVRIPATTSIAAAEHLLLSTAAEELFVEDSDGELLGIVTDCELLKYRLLSLPTTRQVTSIMSRQFDRLSSEAPLLEAAVRMRQQIESRLPVVDHGRLVGQLRRCDVLGYLVAHPAVDAAADDEADEAAHMLSENDSVRAPRFLDLLSHGLRLVGE